MSKRVLSLVLALVMVLGTFGTVFAAESGNDKVDWLVEEGLVVGDAGTGDLRLADAIKRSEVAVMVTKALDLETVANASAAFPSIFKDMSPLHWANGFVNTAAGRGFISGYPNGNFMPENNVNYAEMASMLVRTIPGAMSAEEQAKAVWPTTWLAKAAELGLFDDVAVVDYNAPATRENVFNMVYNAVINKQAGNYSIVKGIVLENDRVEALDADKVVVELINILQRADFVEESRAEKGNQLDLVIPAKVADVEGLLGKVVDFTLDKDGKVVAVKLDTTYKVVEGPINEATRTKLTVAGKAYTVELDERYKGSDERIFRTYHNDKDYKYDNFYKEVKEADYAKVTVKNGKVLYIDSFTFEDIAPVKEVKKDGAEIYVYNDYRDARAEKYAPARVLSYTEEAGLRVSEKAEIEANDVVHVYVSGRNKNIIVRQDALVEGTYEKVREDRFGFWAYVDDEAYFINTDEYRKPVYSYNGEEFMTLEADAASSALWDFRNEEVVVLKDINGDLQLIAAGIEYNEGILIIDQILARGNVRFVQPDNEKVVYEETFDSVLRIGGSTTNQRLSAFNRGDLTFVTNAEDTIDTMERVRRADQIRTGAELVKHDARTKFVINSDLIIVQDDSRENDTRYNVLPRTNVYRMSFNADGDVTALVGTTLEDVRSGASANTNLRAFVLTDADVDALDLGNRALITDRANVAHTIIFTDYTGAQSYNYETIRVTAKHTNPRIIVGVDVNGDEVVGEINRFRSSAVADFNAVKIGDVVKLSLSKADEPLVEAIERRIPVDATTYGVKSISSKTGYRQLVLVDKYGNENPDELWISNNALEFGTIATDLVVQYDTNDFGDVDVLRVYPRTKEITAVYEDNGPTTPTTGTVTYISGRDFNVTLPTGATGTYLVRVGADNMSVTSNGVVTLPGTAWPAGSIQTAELVKLDNLSNVLATHNFVAKPVSGFSGSRATTTPGKAGVTAVTEVAGVDTVTFDLTDGNFVNGDTVTIDGKVLTFVGYTGTTATDAAAAVKGYAEVVTALNDKYTINAAAGVLTFTEKAGKVDGVALTATTSNAYATVTAANTTLGTIGVTGVTAEEQVETLTINVATAAIGEITVTFKDGVQTLVKTIATTASDTTTTVAGKIATEFGTELTNWDVSTSTNTVVFTAKVAAANNTNVTVVVADKY